MNHQTERNLKSCAIISTYTMVQLYYTQYLRYCIISSATQHNTEAKSISEPSIILNLVR